MKLLFLITQQVKQQPRESLLPWINTRGFCQSPAEQRLLHHVLRDGASHVSEMSDRDTLPAILMDEVCLAVPLAGEVPLPREAACCSL